MDIHFKDIDMEKHLLSNGNSLMSVGLVSRYSALVEAANRYKPLFEALGIFTKEEIFGALYGTFYDLQTKYLAKVEEQAKGNKAQAVAQAGVYFTVLMVQYGYKCVEPKADGTIRSGWLLDSVSRSVIGEYSATPSKFEVIQMSKDFAFSLDVKALEEKQRIYITKADDIKRLEKLQSALETLNGLFVTPSLRSIQSVFSFPFNGGIALRDDLTVEVLDEVVKP